jgi:anti-anti-sigma factor
MSAILTLHTARRDDGTLVVKAAGDIDMSSVGTLAEGLTAATTAMAGTADTILVDLSEVEYLDTLAIKVLYEHADHIRVIANPLLMRVLAISGLADVAPVEPAPPTSGP